MDKRPYLLLIKPEGIHRMLIGKIITFLEENGLKIIGLEMLMLSEGQVREIYNNIESAPFYDEVVEYLTSEPCIAIAVDSRFVGIDYLSELCGRIGQWGTVRGIYAHNNLHNIMHCSEVDEKARREAELIFDDENLIEYRHALEKYL